MTSNISPQLQPLAAPLDRLKLLDRNARKGDVKTIAKSYARFGQRKPLVARITGETDEGELTGVVIAGNHQYLAAKQLGWDEIAVVWTDDDDATARAFALADNRLSELGTVDDDILADNLRDIMDFDATLLDAIGYNDKVLDKLLSDSLGDSDSAAPQLGDIIYRLVITCADEEEQAVMMQDLDELGIAYEVQAL